MSCHPEAEREYDICRIKELQEVEAMLLDDDLSDWWDFDAQGIELCRLREDLTGYPYERI